MDHLVEIAKRLNAASDRLNARIAEEEATLKDMNLEVACWIELGISKEFRLGYSKEGVDGGLHWGLYLVQVVDKDQEVTWRLAKAPRGLRLYALKHIPALREALVKTAISLTYRIERFLDTGEDNV